MITVADTNQYGCSEHVQMIRSWLDGLVELQKSEFHLCIAARNYLIVMLTLANATRASNIINITLTDVMQAKADEEYFNAMVMSSPYYKTSMLYGEKKLVISRDIYKQILAYEKYCRPVIMGKSAKGNTSTTISTTATSATATAATTKTSSKNAYDYLFLSKNTQEVMKNSNVPKCLTRSFQLAGCFTDDDDDHRVSCSRIRSYICTELAGTGDEDLKTLSHSFMKHKPETASKYYIKRWSQRESVRISMKCIDRFIFPEETVKEVMDINDRVSKKPVPSYKEVVDYMKKENMVSDDRLTKMLKDLKFTQGDESLDSITPIIEEQTGNNTSPTTSATTVELDEVSKPAGQPSIPLPDIDIWKSNDWYTSDKYTRSTLLSILIIAYKFIASDCKSIKVSDWNSCLTEATDIVPQLKHFSKVQDVKWQDMKNVVNHMHEKYVKSPKSKDFVLFHRDALIMWKNCL